MVVTRSASMSEKVLWGRGACRTGIERRALGAKAGVHTADAYCPQPYFNRVRAWIPDICAGRKFRKDGCGVVRVWGVERERECAWWAPAFAGVADVGCGWISVAIARIEERVLDPPLPCRSYER